MKATIEEVCIKGTSNITQKDIDNNEGQYPVFGASGFIKNINLYHQEKEYVAVIKDGSGIGKPFLLPAKTSVIGTLQYLIPNDKVTAEYLYYLIKSKHLERYYLGAAIPHIYFKDYKKEGFELANVDKQNKITNVLLNIEKIIELENKKIAILDELVKARFVEMFGNVLTNDKGFGECLFGDYVNQMNIGPFGSDLKNDCFVPKDDAYCMVYEQKHAIEKTLDVETRYVNEDKYKHLKRFDVGPGDILVSCRGTIGECYIIPENAPHGIIHPSLMMIKVKDDVNKKFLLYLLEKIMNEQQEQGSGVKMAIKATELAKIKTIKPNRDLQNSFIAFVEQIDKSKFVIEKKIKTLQELLEKKMQEYFN